VGRRKRLWKGAVMVGGGGAVAFFSHWTGMALCS
jgi:hypothetical protein